MWLWLWLFVLPFFILAIIEELIEFLVNRYAVGPAPWEGKLKRFTKRIVERAKDKLRKKLSAEKE